jgi:octaprenyl-diphosphate synthase
VELNGFLAEVDRRTGGILAGGAEALGVPVASLGLSGGKQLRPRLVFECAHALGGDPQRVVPLATAAHLIHTASLCHDDVIDESTQRRGRPTLSARFGNSASVLLGDHLFSSAWLSAARDLGTEVARLLAEAMVEMCGAEILQSRMLWNADTARETCLRVAAGKTAALFAACASAAATALEAPTTAVSALHEFGRGVGLAFQIVDDLLDYNPQSDAWGKQPFMDLRGGLPTLPLLLALDAGDGPVRRAVLDFLRSRGATPLDVAPVACLIRESGADLQCRSLARAYVEQGLSALSRGHVTVNGLADLAYATVGRLF